MWGREHVDSNVPPICQSLCSASVSSTEYRALLVKAGTHVSRTPGTTIIIEAEPALTSEQRIGSELSQPRSRTADRDPSIQWVSRWRIAVGTSAKDRTSRPGARAGNSEIGAKLPPLITD